MNKIPTGRLAADEAEQVHEENRALAIALRDGKPVPIGHDGNVTDKDGHPKLNRIQPGQLAVDEGAVARIHRQNRELAKRLREGKPVEVGRDGSVAKDGQPKLNKIQPGQLAADEGAEARIHRQNRELAKRLQEGKPVEVGCEGNVTDKDGQPKLNRIQPGQLSVGEDAESKIHGQNRELAKRLQEGTPVEEIGRAGNVTDKNGPSSLQIAPGKLAYYGRWYEEDPKLLDDEIDTMSQMFPWFALDTMDDANKRLYWQGILRPGVDPRGLEWEVAAIYNNDFPTPRTGGAVRVFLLNPTIQQVIDSLGWTPHHLIHDSADGTYLCTTRAEDMHAGSQFEYETTAAQALTWAVKWLTALELVMAGDMSKELFNRPGGI